MKEIITELKDNREDLHTMIDTISGFREKVDTLLPDKVEYRNRHMMVERMKNITEIIKSELAVRKQIDESIKLETDMRRKAEDGDIEQTPEAIRAYAKAMEIMYKNKKDKNKTKTKPELSVVTKEKKK